jgi:hypothetical protein
MKEYKIVCDIEYPDGRILKQTAPILYFGSRHYTIYPSYDEAVKYMETIIESGKRYEPYGAKPPIQRNYVILSRDVSEWTL